MDGVLFAVVFVAVSVLALLVRTVLRVPPRLVSGSLDYAHVPTPLSPEETFESLTTLQLFSVVRNDDKRGVVVLEATRHSIAQRLLDGKRVRTFGYWIFLVLRPLPDEQGTDVAVGVQRKWLEFGEGSKILRTAIRDATVRELWTKLPPPPLPPSES